MFGLFTLFDHNAVKTLVYKFLCEHTFAVLLVDVPRSWTVGQTLTLCLIFWGTAKLCSKVAALYIPTSSVGGLFFSPHPQQCFLLSIILIIVIFVGVKWYLIVVFICIFLMSNEWCWAPFNVLIGIYISPVEKWLFISLVF